ncbi:MAG TPA: 30S ribosomal protein S5 [Candidatus Paceibacterota bacterium]|nr:30S ribosomal protein S5 [Candidatus Paceibacterota bacterium]
MERGNQHGNNRRGGPGGHRGGPRPERPKPEYDHKIVDIRRVARVVAGGRRFSFAVTLVAGNRKGKVGVGTGKAGDTALAIEKAMNSAKKAMITVRLTKTSSIRHETAAKYGSSSIIIKPAPARGIVAGSSVRNVLDLAGVHDVNAKVLSRSKNKLNNARAAIIALEKIK